MNVVQRFAEYAAAFEEYFEKGDEAVLEPFFTEDAVYETLSDPPFGGRHDGRVAVFAALKQSLDTFDKRFETRTLENVEGPEERDGEVWMRWKVTYTQPGAPPLVIDGEETATFQGDRIVRLEDRFSSESAAGALRWMQDHGEKLGSA